MLTVKSKSTTRQRLKPNKIAVRKSQPGNGFAWWGELSLVLVFYVIYTIVRNQFGSATISPDSAYRNAEKIMDLERFLGTFWELQIQEWFIGNESFITFWNHFYGSCHFGVTIFTLIWLYMRFPRRYSHERTTFLCTTGFALIGYSTFPLMPPRLLSNCNEYGACLPKKYPFVDTLSDVGGLWSFDSGTMQEVTNQFAAMPSLHFAWAVWCGTALWPVLKKPWAKTLIFSYPIATLFAIIVTANHYWLDALGGTLLLCIGYTASNCLTHITKSSP